MARFSLSRAARADLESIAIHTDVHWGSGQAAAYLDALEDGLRFLSDRPRTGRARPELSDGLRSFPVDRHVVYYVETDEGIVVIRILHERQDPVRHI